ncbi:MAG: hypothetical protein V1736_12315 [Pseudomonadota bacterium]
MSGHGHIIGIDFDNTIVDYDDLIYGIALEKGLIDCGTRKSKRCIRDTIRKLPNGEVEWQKIQAAIYGPKMNGARLIDGVSEFFNFCKARGFLTYIISHKTQFAGYDETGSNLRTAALGWMRKKHFFENDGLGLVEDQVFFESCRAAKIRRVEVLGCTYFIDDLEETFLENFFPAACRKILYAPHETMVPGCEVTVAASWKEIQALFSLGLTVSTSNAHES